MPGTPAAINNSSSGSSSGSGAGPLQGYTDSCWYRPNCHWASITSGGGLAAGLGLNAAGSSWQRALCSSVVSTWPGFAGSVADVHLGASPVVVAGFSSSAGELHAASKNSSTPAKEASKQSKQGHPTLSCKAALARNAVATHCIYGNMKSQYTQVWASQGPNKSTPCKLVRP
jgi:hypothetical protein